MPGLLYADKYKINDNISVKIPLVGEVLDNEDAYYGVVNSIVSTPYDYMVQLDDIGIDFTKITSFDLFCLLFGSLKTMDTSLVLGDLDLKKFETAVNNQNGEIVLRNEEDDIIIDRAIHGQMAACLRKILNIPRTEKTPGNEDARIYMLEKARKKQKRMSKQKKPESRLEDYIIALVNSADFPYDYESVRNITIYQFYESLRQIIHKVRYDKTMIGVYAGTVSVDKLPLDERSWISTSTEK